MTLDEQLALWVAGDARCPSDRDECCPDFGCCNPTLLSPPEVRQRFFAAQHHERMQMLGNFLTKFLAYKFPKNPVPPS